MDRFYFIVLTVATISLILFLTYIGILMKYYSKSDLAYPSIANTCPDYWTLDTDPTTGQTKCTVPDDGKPNRGTVSGTNEVTEVMPYGEDSIICDLKNWANTNSIVWDGVSNYNKCGL